MVPASITSTETPGANIPYLIPCSVTIVGGSKKLSLLDALKARSEAAL